MADTVNAYKSALKSIASNNANAENTRFNYDSNRASSMINEAVNATNSLGKLLNDGYQNYLDKDLESKSGYISKDMEEYVMAYTTDESGKRVSTGEYVSTPEGIKKNMYARIDSLYEGDKGLFKEQRKKNAYKYADKLYESKKSDFENILIKKDLENFQSVASYSVSNIGMGDAFAEYESRKIAIETAMEDGRYTLSDSAKKIKGRMDEILANIDSITPEQTAEFYMLNAKLNTMLSSKSMGENYMAYQFKTMDFDAKCATNYAVNSAINGNGDTAGLYSEVLVGTQSKEAWIKNTMDGFVENGIDGLDGHIDISEGDVNYTDMKKTLEDKVDSFEKNYTETQKTALEDAKKVASTYSATGEDFFMYDSKESYASYMVACSEDENGKYTLDYEYALANIPQDVMTEISIRNQKNEWISDASKYYAIKGTSLESFAKMKASEEGKTEYSVEEYKERYEEDINRKTSEFLYGIMSKGEAEYQWFKDTIGIGDYTTTADDIKLTFTPYELATSLFSDPFNRSNKYTDMVKAKKERNEKISDYENESWVRYKSTHMDKADTLEGLYDFVATTEGITYDSKFYRDEESKILSKMVAEYKGNVKEADKKSEEYKRDNDYISYLENVGEYLKTKDITSYDDLSNIKGFDLNNTKIREYVISKVKSIGELNQKNREEAQKEEEKLNVAIKKITYNNWMLKKGIAEDKETPSDILDFLDSKEALDNGISITDEFIINQYNTALGKLRTKVATEEERNEADAYFENVNEAVSKGYGFNFKDDYEKVEGYNPDNKLIAEYVTGEIKGMHTILKSKADKQKESEIKDFINLQTQGDYNPKEVLSNVMNEGYSDTEARTLIKSVDSNFYTKLAKYQTKEEIKQYIEQDNVELYSGTKELVDDLNEKTIGTWMNITDSELDKLIDSWYGNKEYYNQFVLGRQYLSAKPYLMAGYIYRHQADDNPPNGVVADAILSESLQSMLGSVLAKNGYESLAQVPVDQLYDFINQKVFGGKGITVDGETITAEDLGIKIVSEGTDEEFYMTIGDNELIAKILLPHYKRDCLEKYKEWENVHSSHKIDDSVTFSQKIKSDVTEESSIRNDKALKEQASQGLIHLGACSVDGSISSGSWRASKAEIEATSKANLIEFAKAVAEVNPTQRYNFVNENLMEGGDWYGKLTLSDYQIALEYAHGSYNSLIEKQYGKYIDVDGMIENMFKTSMENTASSTYGTKLKELFLMNLKIEGTFSNDVEVIIAESLKNNTDPTEKLKNLINEEYHSFTSSRMSKLGKNSIVATEVEKFIVKTDEETKKKTYDYGSTQIKAIANNIDSGNATGFGSVGLSDVGELTLASTLMGMEHSRANGTGNDGDILSHYEWLLTSSKDDSGVHLTKTEELLTLGLLIAYEEMSGIYLDNYSIVDFTDDKSRKEIQDRLGQELTDKYGGSNDVLNELLTYGIGLVNATRDVQIIKNSCVSELVKDAKLTEYANGFVDASRGILFTTSKSPLNGKKVVAIVTNYDENNPNYNATDLITLEGCSQNASDIEKNLKEIGFGETWISVTDTKAIKRMEKIAERNDKSYKVFGNEADVYLPVYQDYSYIGKMKVYVPCYKITRFSYDDAVKFVENNKYPYLMRTSSYNHPETSPIFGKLISHTLGLDKGSFIVDLESLLPSV